jgi:hypothetical protein
MGTGALVAGPLGFMVGMAAKKDRKLDARELYLILQDDSWGVVIPFSPDRGAGVRQLALDIASAARRAPQASLARAQQVERAEAKLREVQGETTSTDAATRNLEAVRAERPALPPAPPPLTDGSSSGLPACGAASASSSRREQIDQWLPNSATHTEACG